MALYGDLRLGDERGGFATCTHRFDDGFAIQTTARGYRRARKVTVRIAGNRSHSVQVALTE